MNRILLIIVLSFFSLPVLATSYYVKNGGDDKADGTSKKTPLAHHPWMANYTGKIILTEGDTVYMCRGDVWIYSGPQKYFINVKTGGTSGNHIVTTAYGTGEKPKIVFNANITGSSVIYGGSKAYLIFDNLDISHYSSLYSGKFMNGFNLFDVKGDPCHDWIITNCDVHNIPSCCIYAGHDSYNIIIGDTTAYIHADTINYSNQFYNWGYAGILLLGTNPLTLVSNNKISYNYIHSSTRKLKNENVYGIALSVQKNSSSWPNNCIIKCNYLENIATWHGIDTHGTTSLLIKNNYIKNIGRRAISILSADYSMWGIPPVLRDIRIEGNIIELNPDKLPVRAEGSQITIFGQKLKPAKNIKISNNTCFYTVRPTNPINMPFLSLINSDSIYILQNTFYNGPVFSSNFPAIFLTNNCRNIFIEKNYIKDFWYGIAGRGKSLSGPILIRNNILTNTKIGIIINELNENANIKIYNNQFSNLHIAKPISEKSIVILKNNIIGFTQSDKESSYLNIPLATFSGNFISDFNIYTGPGSSKSLLFNISGKNYTIKQWQKLGYDLNSFEETNLLFRNTFSEMNDPVDFNFKRSSPLRNSGDPNVEISEDYFGNSRVRTPDIGPVEYKPWWKKQNK